jgi:signal transduction histidine kinase
MGRVYLALFLFVLSCLRATGQQEADPNVAWYEEFFQEKKRKPVEESLRTTTSKLEQAIKTNSPEEHSKALKELSLIHLTRTSDYETAIDLLVKCLVIEDSLDLKEQRIFTYLAMAKVFEVVGNYNKSEELLEQALGFNKSLDNPNIQVLILNGLGQINASTGKLKEAFTNYEQVLQYGEIIENPKVEAQALFNIAHLCSTQGDYKNSLQNYRRSLALRRSLRDKADEASTLNNIGELYRLMKNDTKALANHELALKIRKVLKDEKGIAESYNNIGILYYQQKKIEKAISSLQSGLQAALGSQSLAQQLKSYDYLSFCYKEMGNYEAALQSREGYMAVNDFIQNQRFDERLLESQNRYVIDTKESQIEILETDRLRREQELTTQKNLRNFLISLIALASVIVGLIYYSYKVKKRAHSELQQANEKVSQQNAQLQDLNATKDKFFSIIGHDLKGPLNSLTSFSRLLIQHTDRLTKEEIQMLAKDFDKSLKNLLTLLENLLEWSRSQTGNIEFKPEVFDITSLLKDNRDLLNSQAINKKISIMDETEENKVLVIGHKQSINTVVRNLISNAIKFTPGGGLIKLGVHKKGPQIVVSIADTGVGMSQQIIEKLFRIDSKHSTKGTDDEKGTGLGLILCKEFVEKNGGKLWVESEESKGSVFYFTLAQAS